MTHDNGSSNDHATSVSSKAVLLIGAGGIGCEVLKNLVLCGVETITVIDLDTIEVSNLNRQFLFRREHVGMSKAMVAAEAMRKIRPTIEIQAIHGNVLDSNILSLNLIRQFSCVINALDNIIARSHVNRLCMAANIPLIETGSAGYLGQTSFIVKGRTECYDCTPRKDDRNRTYPACTIRNTPSEPAHCVIWAKYLFGQLFGDADPDAEVSPDPDDPELGKSAGNSNDAAKVNTRQWAEKISYDASALLKKLFCEDVSYLLKLDSLWKKRVPPVALEINDADINSENHAVGMTDVQQRDYELWSRERCIATFSKAVALLHERMLKDGSISFDKDDDLAIDFVTSAANLRCKVFHINGLTRFTAKSIAGNIIAAIATTNSVIAGSAVIIAVLNILSTKNSHSGGVFNNVQQVVLRRNPVPTGRARNRTNAIFLMGTVQPPNTSCYVCSPDSRNSILLEIAFDFSDKGGSLKALRDRLLISKLHFAVPELVTTDGRLLISADEEDNDETAMSRTLQDVGISTTGGCIALVEDMSQSISVSISFSHAPGVSFDDALENFQVAPVQKKQEPVSATTNAPPVATNSRKRPLEVVDDSQSPAATPAKKATSPNNGHENGNGVVHILDDEDDCQPQASGPNHSACNGNGHGAKLVEAIKKSVSKNDEDDDCVLVL